MRTADRANDDTRTHARQARSNYGILWSTVRCVKDNISLLGACLCWFAGGRAGIVRATFFFVKTALNNFSSLIYKKPRDNAIMGPSMLKESTKEAAGVPSGFILKLYQMVNGAPDDIISVSV